MNVCVVYSTYGSVRQHCGVRLAAVHMAITGPSTRAALSAELACPFSFFVCECVCKYTLEHTLSATLPGGAGVFGRINIAALV